VEFIAEDPINIGIRAAKAPLFDTDGQMVKEGTRRLYAKFDRGTAPEYAYQEALKIFSFAKIHRDISPRQWVSFYDSLTAQLQHGWTDEERKCIEDELCKSPHAIKVEQPRIKAPYPAYTRQRKTQGARTIKHAIAEIVETVKTTGIDPELVISYELQNDQNTQVIEAMQALKDEEAVDEPVIAA
jgi:hypothetical protein